MTLKSYFDQWLTCSKNRQNHLHVLKFNLVIAAKALLRGLGTPSSLISYQSFSGFNYLAPLVRHIGETSTFHSLSAVDTLIYSGSTSFAVLANSAVTFPSAKLDPTKYSQKAELFPLFAMAAKKMQQLLVSGQAKLVLPSGELPITTISARLGFPVEFRFGKSKYTKATIQDNLDFLLNPQPGDSNKLLRDHVSTKPLLGPLTLDLLSHIGYSLVHDVSIPNFKVVDSYRTEAYSPAEAAIDNDDMNGANLINTFADPDTDYERPAKSRRTSPPVESLPSKKLKPNPT